MSILGVFIIIFVGSSCAASRFFSSSTEIIDDKGIAMRLVPAGEFTMGSDDDSDNRNSAHRVYLEGFYIDEYEVTNANYQECVIAGVVILRTLRNPISAPVITGIQSTITFL